jgi:hypothetical protein
MNLGDASDKTLLEVWFKLNDNDVDAVDLPKGTNVRKFRDEVKDKCTVSLQHCDAAMLHVFAPGADPKTETALDPGDPVPGDTSSKNPLIVVAPKPHQQPQQDGELRYVSCILVFEVLFEYGNASVLAYLEYVCLFRISCMEKNPFFIHRCADSLSTRS